MPIPAKYECDPWWRHPLSADDNSPHVIARLPFGARGNARSDGADALAIGRGSELPTGQDRTLFAAEYAPDISRGRIVSTLSELGLACTSFTSCGPADRAPTLLGIAGLVAAAAP